MHEHLSSKIGVDYIRSAFPQVARLDHALPHGADAHRLARRRQPAVHVLHAGDQDRGRPAGAAQGRDVGRRSASSSARIPRRIRSRRKLALVGIPGLFCGPVAIESYAKIFEEEGALDKLEAFASLNGPKHYGLPPNEDTITLEKRPWVAPVAMKVEGPDELALIHKGGETIDWQVVET